MYYLFSNYALYMLTNILTIYQHIKHKIINTVFYSIFLSVFMNDETLFLMYLICLECKFVCFGIRRGLQDIKIPG